MPRTPHTQHNRPSGHTGEQEPRGQGHRTRHTTHRAGTPVNRIGGAQDTAHAKQRTERAHRQTGVKWPKTPHLQSNAPSRHTGEQEPSGSGPRKRKATHRAATPVNMSQLAQDNTHTCTRRAAEGQERSKKPMDRTHWDNPADPSGEQQGRYPKAAGRSPARLHQGPWQTSPGAMEATGDRRAGTQSRSGSPAKQKGPATQATRVRRL